MSDNVHKNHRERMRRRAEKDGISSFADHELLEYLLFHSIPRVDTNPTAHALLEEFGSIKAIMDASENELCRVKGIGPGSALLFKLMIEFLRRYEAGCFQVGKTFQKLAEVIQYLYPKFLGVNVERVYLLLFNNRMNLIDCVFLSEGEVNCSDASIRKITEIVLNKNASSVIIAHNHPNGLAIPSSEDLHLTDTLNSYLSTLGVVLVEHLIFADTVCRPIMEQHCGRFRCSPISKRLENGFYENFYEGFYGLYRIDPAFYEPSKEELDEVEKINQIRS